MSKTFIGPRLRQLRRDNKQTQAEMARRLGVSTSYVNLLESNQRSLSVQMLVALTEHYGIDWRDLVADNDMHHLSDLRAAVRDPVITGEEPDLQELRAACENAPRLVEAFLQLHRNYRNAVENMMQLGSTDAVGDLVVTSPEAALHDFFRRNSNYFDSLEQAASVARGQIGAASDDMYALLKRHLRMAHGIDVKLGRIHDMPETLRAFDEDQGLVTLSEALDHPNRIFQLAHVLGLVAAAAPLEALIASSAIPTTAGRARCQVELANYFAAALLMPYAEVLDLAQRTSYDVDRIAAAMGTSYEQVCHRLTTLQRDGARGVPLFFLRIDKAGNVTKRFNATPFTLAERGGACPVWNIHDAFRMPGVILPQFVELPDGGQFFTFSRTIDRPVFSRATQDRRLVIALGCERSHAHQIGYAAQFDIERRELVSLIGINCHLCPRQACSQRAAQPLHVALPLDANRRGQTRYES